MVLKQVYLKVNQARLGSIGVVLSFMVVLFPFGWLANTWPGFDRIADFLFGTELAHVVGHFALFSLSGTVILVRYPHLMRKPRIYLLVLLAAGILQEFLQLATFKQRMFMSDELLDIVVDLLGAAFTLEIYRKLIATFDIQGGSSGSPSD